MKRKLYEASVLINNVAQFSEMERQKREVTVRSHVHSGTTGGNQVLESLFNMSEFHDRALGTYSTRSHTYL